MFRPLASYAEGELRRFLYERPEQEELFLAPVGEAGYVSPEGLTAEIYASPLTVFIGGVAAVVLELAEPRVRHGVWDHSIFPQDPVTRLRRTGLAAMVTFYAARSVADGMIGGINRRHEAVSGTTPGGERYYASDTELLLWVQATAAFGFIEAFSRYASELSEDDWSRALVEAAPVARTYGVEKPPLRRTDLDGQIAAMLPRLEASETLDTFLSMMRRAPAMPLLARGFQPLLVRAAVEIVPAPVRVLTGLEGQGLRRGEHRLVRGLVRAARSVHLRNHPRELARRRLGGPIASSQTG